MHQLWQQRPLGPIGPPPNNAPVWTSASKLVWVVPNFAPYNLVRYGSTVGVSRRALWETPVFDMRYGADHEMGGSNTAYPLHPGATLWAQMYRVDGVYISATTNDAKVYTLERTHPFDTRLLRTGAPRLDVTVNWYNAAESSPLAWAPPGPPVRYWQVIVVIDWMNAGIAPPELACDAGAY